jgi:hypothetical protein
MTKCTLHVSPAITAMNTSAIRLNVLVCGDAQAWTATISATMKGIMRMIKISRIANNGLPIGCCGDCSDTNPATSVMA